MKIEDRMAAKSINLNPIQRGGILTDDARRVLQEYGDGYAFCDYCLKGRMYLIDTPPLRTFHQIIAEWLEMDDVRFTLGNRHAQRIIFKVLSKRGKYVIIDANAHYTTYIAAELAGLRVKEVPHTGYPDFKTIEDMYEEKIKEVKRESGEMPIAVFATHVDSYYGNLIDAKRIAKISHDNDIPFILNCAYTMGIMPISRKSTDADFLLGSGHKSMASTAPIGVLATTSEWANKVFRESKIEGDWSGRAFPTKDLESVGCELVGTQLLTMMASFPTVKERVKKFDYEIENARYFVRKIERIGEDAMALGETPRKHTLIHFDIPDFYWATEKKRGRGFYVYKFLKKRNIFGVQPGKSKDIKVNTYGLKKSEIDYVIKVFYELAEELNIPIM